MSPVQTNQALSPAKASLLILPPELLDVLFAQCDYRSLARLAQCSKAYNALIKERGWPAYTRRHLFVHSITGHRRFDLPVSSRLVKECVSVDSSWEHLGNIAHEDVHVFPGRALPVLKLQEEAKRLLIAGGSSLTTFTFPGHAAKPVEELHLRPTLHRDSTGRLRNERIGRTATDDITSISCIGGTNEFVLSHVSGLLQKCKIEEASDRRPRLWSLCRYDHPRRCIQSSDVARLGLMATAASHHGGILSIYKVNAPWQDPVQWRTKSRPWTVLLDPSQGRPHWLAVGQASQNPCLIYQLDEKGIPLLDSPIPLLGNERKTAAYAFASPSERSPIGPSGQTIISGLYDGTVRVHDLRSASRMPVLQFIDPFADAPVYSVASGGGAGCTIAAGTARHGLVRWWDIRQAREDSRSGCSVFGPGRDSSPVYGLQMEYDRLFGVTDRRAWMMSFGESRQSNNLHTPHDPIQNKAYSRERGGGSEGGVDLRYTEHRFSHARISSTFNNNILSYYRHSDMSLKSIV